MKMKCYNPKIKRLDLVGMGKNIILYHKVVNDLKATKQINISKVFQCAYRKLMYT